jgi:OmpA-OmpF porin, OOP family
MVVRGRVVDPTGRGLQAALVVRGPQQAFETVSDGQGLFEISLLPGKHVIRTQSPGFELQELQVDAVAGTETTVEVRLQPPSLDPTVQLEARAIKVARAIHFVNGGTELTPDSQIVLKSVGEVLGVHPEISLVRVVAHWDDSVGKATADELTSKQAEAVRTFLLGRGVAPSRLVAAGAGAAFPLVAAPTSPANRLRNRRVEFQIVR